MTSYRTPPPDPLDRLDAFRRWARTAHRDELVMGWWAVAWVVVWAALAVMGSWGW